MRLRPGRLKCEGSIKVEAVGESGGKRCEEGGKNGSEGMAETETRAVNNVARDDEALCV